MQGLTGASLQSSSARLTGVAILKEGLLEECAQHFVGCLSPHQKRVLLCLDTTVEAGLQPTKAQATTFETGFQPIKAKACSSPCNGSPHSGKPGSQVLLGPQDNEAYTSEVSTIADGLE